MAASSRSRICSGRRRPAERGGVLLAVLLVTLLTTMLVMGAVYEAGVRLERRVGLRDGALALAAAQAGLEDAARLATTTTDWRANLMNGLWIEQKPLGDASISVDAEDPLDGEIRRDGALISSSADSVRLTATAALRGIARSRQATYLPFPHEALRYVGFSATTLGLQNVALEGRLRASGAVAHQGGATLHGDVTTLAGQSISADLDDLDTDFHYAANALALPAIDFAWFQAAGERITLPYNRTIANTVITANRNPYGSPSAAGIYWIDAGRTSVYFYNVAVEACLVIRNATTVTIGDWYGGTTYYYHHTPDPDRLPALLVEGHLTMRIEAGGTLGGAGGLVPGIRSDLEGVFACTGTLWGPQDSAVAPIECDGAFLANELHLLGPCTRIRHRPELDLQPLAELTGVGLRLLPGTTRVAG